MTILFSDGFESGDFSAWNTVSGAGMSVTNTTAHHGTYSMLTTSGWLRYAVNPTQATLFMRVYLNFASLPSVGQSYYLLRFGDSWKVWYRNNGGTNQWLVSIGGTEYTYNQDISANTWISLEFGMVISTTLGEAHLYIDGVEVIDQTGLNTGSTKVWQVYVIREGGTISTIYADCVVVSDSYIGPESSGPRFYGDGLSWVVLR